MYCIQQGIFKNHGPGQNIKEKPLRFYPFAHGIFQHGPDQHGDHKRQGDKIPSGIINGTIRTAQIFLCAFQQVVNDIPGQKSPTACQTQYFFDLTH